MSTSFDVIVIGGGSAGLGAAGLAANLGARTLLIEKGRLGGDCTWTGCVPSKSLLRAARVAEMVRRAGEFGIDAGEPRVDFAAVMQRVRRIREQIYREADAPERLEAMGIVVQRARARFHDAHRIELEDGSLLEGRYIIVATGSKPRVPDVTGLSHVPFETTESLFEQSELPRRLLVVGAGPVGIELAQAFQRLGSQVSVVDRIPRILRQHDREPSDMLQALLTGEGVAFHLGRTLQEVSSHGDGVRIQLAGGSPPDALTGDRLLVAVGRQPNVEGLNLRAAGIEFDERGIRVDERCRTSASGVYAVGDVTGRYHFAHMAEHMARTAISNALLKIPSRLDASHVSWTTFTEPELAHAGPTLEDLEKSGRRYEIHRFPYDRLDRALTEGAAEGLVQIYARPVDGRILGATVLGARAGELISELTLAMRHGIPLRKISDTIHPYPTYGMGVRRAADQWYVRRRSVKLLRGLKRIFGYRGELRDYGPDEIL